MAQQVIPAAQLVPRFHTIGRYNNYAVMQSIPCSPECKNVGQILLDHRLGYALTTIIDVPTFIYIVDMFRDVLYFPMETLENPFVAPVNIEIIEAFMNMVGYQGVIDKEIRATGDFKEYETVFMNVDVLMNQPQPVVSTQGTHSSPQKLLKITIRQQKVVKGEKDGDDSEDRLEPESHKDNPEHVNEDDDKDKEKVDEEEGGDMGSLETRTKEMQTPIPTELRSPRTILSSDMNITQELTDTVLIPTTTTSNTPHSK
ncbi:hypothetical protein Tco_1024091 [Tanacetum coccineum]